MFYVHRDVSTVGKGYGEGYDEAKIKLYGVEDICFATMKSSDKKRPLKVSKIELKDNPDAITGQFQLVQLVRGAANNNKKKKMVK